MVTKEFWDSAAKARKILGEKYCLANASGGCRGSIVEAHTVPRSQLSKIAVAGHVYSFKNTMEYLAKTGGKFSIEKVGINKFSVLHCFCAGHDNSLFSPIEDEALKFNEQQIGLLHFRAIGLEFYKKQAGLKFAEFAAEKVKNRNRDSSGSRGLIEAHLLGTRLGVRDVTASFQKCQEGVSRGDFSKFCALVVLFKRMPSIMTVGAFAPEFGYDGAVFERTRLGQLKGPGTTHTSISILSADGGAAVVFAWLKDAASGLGFANSFVAQKRELYSTLAIQTAFEHIENTCMQPIWWDDMRKVERAALVRRMQTAGSPTEERKSGALQYCGITFDDWDYESHHYVNC
jgi:hypothetical protein